MKFFSTQNYSYLKHNRLADIIALIQVLALDTKTHRSINGLTSELQSIPKSANSWMNIAEEHPEFFRFNKKRYNDAEKKDDENCISLISRHVLDPDSNGKRGTSEEFTNKLVETALKFYSIQREHAEKWKTWIPILIAFLSIIGSYYLNYKNSKYQEQIKKYELQLKPKQEGYSKFMNAFSQTFFSAESGNSDLLYKQLDIVESAYYNFEPFLENKDKEFVWELFQKYSQFCSQVCQKSNEPNFKINEYVNEFTSYKINFRSVLIDKLFTHTNVTK